PGRRTLTTQAARPDPIAWPCPCLHERFWCRACKLCRLHCGCAERLLVDVGRSLTRTTGRTSRWWGRWIRHTTTSEQLIVRQLLLILRRPVRWKLGRVVSENVRKLG